MHLFFYGTLAGPHRAQTVAGALAALGPGRAAWARGTLVAVGTAEGWYPALAPGPGRVSGWLHRAGSAFTRADLAVLDTWEEFRPRAPGRSEYLRRTIPVRLARGGQVLAQAYLWSGRPRPRCVVPVAHGDFGRFLAETGLPVFGGG